MSENVGSSGIMVPLSRQMTEEEREEIQEAFRDNGTDVHINYDGTLAYTDNRSDGYGITFGVTIDTDDLITIRQALNPYGFGIVEYQSRPYSCYWYNGTDSDMDMMTLEEFLEQTRQK
jgi:hypothetical protein